MAYGKDTMYKNPQVQGPASPVGAKRPGAPSRTRGMMGMAAQARAGAPRQGAPPVPVTSAPPRKKKKDPRVEAARRMLGGAEFESKAQESGGGHQQPPQEPTQLGPAYQPGTSMETQGPAEPITYEKPSIGPPVPLHTPDITKLEGQAPPEPITHEKPSLGPPQEGPGELYIRAGGDPPPEVDISPAWAQFYKDKGMSWGGPPEIDPQTQAHSAGIAEMDVGPKPEPDTKSEPEPEPEPMDSDEKFEWVWNNIVDQMSTQTGISKEELASQMQGIENASVEQMSQLAQQMAARGLSFSGLAGAGMANIAAASMQAMVDLQYEHSKLALQDRIERAKMFMSMYGNMLSEQQRMEIFDKMQAWEREQWETAQQQKEEADRWIEVNDKAALLRAMGGWDTKALAWAMWANRNGYTPSQIISNLQAVGESPEDAKITLINPGYVPPGVEPGAGEQWDEGGWEQQTGGYGYGSGYGAPGYGGVMVPPGSQPKHYPSNKEAWDKESEGAKAALNQWSYAHDNYYNQQPPSFPGGVTAEEYYGMSLVDRQSQWMQYLFKHAGVSSVGLNEWLTYLYGPDSANWPKELWGGN